MLVWDVCVKFFFKVIFGGFFFFILVWGVCVKVLLVDDLDWGLINVVIYFCFLLVKL